MVGEGSNRGIAFESWTKPAVSLREWLQIQALLRQCEQIINVIC